MVFVCGSDEHGAAITIKAKKEGKTPKEIIDQYHTIIKDSFEKFGIAFDIYHRTSEPIHYETSQEIFLRLLENNAFEVKESEQYYDAEAQQFLADIFDLVTQFGQRETVSGERVDRAEYVTELIIEEWAERF